MSDTAEDVEEPLYLHEVLAQFDQPSASDVLRLGALKPQEVLQTLLDAVDRGQFVYKVVHPDGWTAQIITTHGAVAVEESTGKFAFHTVAPMIHRGTRDVGEQVRITQERHREEDQGWRTETGGQFGRWCL